MLCVNHRAGRDLLMFGVSLLALANFNVSKQAFARCVSFANIKHSAIVSQIKSKFQDNCSLCNTSTKFGMNNA